MVSWGGTTALVFIFTYIIIGLIQMIIGVDSNKNIILEPTNKFKEIGQNSSDSIINYFPWIGWLVIFFIYTRTFICKDPYVNIVTGITEYIGSFKVFALFLISIFGTAALIGVYDALSLVYTNEEQRKRLEDRRLIGLIYLPSLYMSLTIMMYLSGFLCRPAGNRPGFRQGFDIFDLFIILITAFAIWYYYSFELGKLNPSEEFGGEIASPDPRDLTQFLNTDPLYKQKYKNYIYSYKQGLEPCPDQHIFSIAQKKINCNLLD
jgi:hypothetical protein